MTSRVHVHVSSASCIVREATGDRFPWISIHACVCVRVGTCAHTGCTRDVPSVRFEFQTWHESEENHLKLYCIYMWEKLIEFDI